MGRNLYLDYGCEVNQYTEEDIKTLTRWLVSPIYWFKDCVITNDEARANLGLEPELPFPMDEEYLQLLLYYADAEKVIWVNKSRRMLATWLFSSRLLYKACFFKGSANFIISTDKTASDKLIEKRCKFVYEHIPPKYRHLHPRGFKTKNLFTFKEMNSYIEGLPAGPGQIRGETGSNIFWDEIAEQPKILQTWEALYFAVKGGGHVQGITTPMDNDFKRLFYGLKEEAFNQIPLLL